MATRRTTTKAAPVAEPVVLTESGMDFSKTTARTTVYKATSETPVTTTIYVDTDQLAAVLDGEADAYTVELTITFTPKA